MQRSRLRVLFKTKESENSSRFRREKVPQWGTHKKRSNEPLISSVCAPKYVCNACGKWPDLKCEVEIFMIFF